MAYLEPSASSARYICIDMEDGETAPVLDAVSPSSAPVLQDVALTLAGKGFRPGDTLRVGAVDVSPTEVSSKQITALVLGAVLALAGPIAVRVVRGSYVTASVNLTVTP